MITLINVCKIKYQLNVNMFSWYFDNILKSKPKQVITTN